MNIVGIDPGVSGGLALLDTGMEFRDPRGLVSVHDMPVHVLKSGKSTRREIDAPGLVALILSLSPEHVWIEQVGPRPHDGVVAAWKFAHSAGVLVGVLAAMRVPVSYIAPAAWQKQTGTNSGPDGSRRRATEMFPRHGADFRRVADSGRAAAALIALAGAMRSEQGVLSKI